MNEMKLNWSDLQLFLAVARGGGLAGGATLTGLSPPSLGRHMTNLERDYGEPLFVRKARGYDLTKAGAVLLQQAGEVEQRVLDIERRRDSRNSSLPVHISAGTWTSYFLASHVMDIRMDGVRLVFQTSEATQSLQRREATIGIRNLRPHEPSLAIRKLGAVAFAPFVAKDAIEETSWLASAIDTPSANWVRINQADNISIQVSQPRGLLDLAIAGAGQAVLPCFIGDREDRLMRSGEPIGELIHKQWLVVHGEDRHQPQVRKTINALSALFEAHTKLFAGLA